MQSADVLIVGAGMAGASAAYFLAPHVRVLLLEREAQPGYHATGRSAAMYSETYGNATVRAITTASKPFYFKPPPGFAEHPLVTPRGSLIVGSAADQDHLRTVWQDLRDLVPDVQWWTQDDILQHVPVLRPEAAHCGVYEPNAMDMDVHAIHQGFLRGAKAVGAQLVCGAGVQRMQRESGVWRVDTEAGSFSAPVVINAAGAWGDELARLAGVATIGLVPKRRTAFTTEAPAGCDIGHWPLVIDAQESFYFVSVWARHIERTSGRSDSVHYEDRAHYIEQGQCPWPQEALLQPRTQSPSCPAVSPRQSVHCCGRNGQRHVSG